MITFKCYECLKNIPLKFTRWKRWVLEISGEFDHVSEKKKWLLMHPINGVYNKLSSWKTEVIYFLWVQHCHDPHMFFEFFLSSRNKVSWQISSLTKIFFGYPWSFYWTNKLRYRKLPIKHPERLFSNRSFCVGACLNWLLNRTRMFIKKMRRLRQKKYQTSKFLTKSQNPFQNSFQNWSKKYFF